MRSESAGQEQAGFTLQRSCHADMTSGLLIRLLSEGQIDLQRAGQTLLLCTSIIHRLDLLCVYVCDLLSNHRAFCLAFPPCVLWPFFCLTVGLAGSSLAWSLCMLRTGCKMAPRRKPETCTRLSVSGVGSHFKITFCFWPRVNFRLTCKPAGSHAGGLRNEFCVFLGEVSVGGSQKGGRSAGVQHRFGCKN